MGSRGRSSNSKIATKQTGAQNRGEYLILGYLRPEFAPEPVSSFRTICPPFMTNFTRSSSVTSVAGLPETAMKSANLPFSMDPTRSFQPIFSAPTEVAERIACSGVIPYSTMVEYGMTPLQAIRSATSVGAENIGWKDRVGSIEKGKFADFIAVSGNPATDVTELERVKFVMKGGQIVRNELTGSGASLSQR